MNIYIVYKKEYADFENGEPDDVYIYDAYKSKKRAIRKAKALMNEMKSNKLYIDEDIRNTKNPFKRNNWVDFYKESEDQSEIVSSIILEEKKLIA